MFYCQLCDNYSTEERSLIHKHHIIPRELKGSNKESNLVYVCSNCHNRIYIPESSNGQHSRKTKKSVQILKWFSSTQGRLLLYINENGEEIFSPDKNILT